MQSSGQAASGMTGLGFGKHGAHELVEPRAVLGDGGFGIGLPARKLGADFRQPPLDAAVNDERTRQKGADTRRDLCVELACIGPSNRDAGEFPGTSGCQVLTPKAGELHVCTEPSGRGPVLLSGHLSLYSLTVVA